jgi:hypothetical protein
MVHMTLSKKRLFSRAISPDPIGLSSSMFGDLLLSGCDICPLNSQIRQQLEIIRNRTLPEKPKVTAGSRTLPTNDNLVCWDHKVVGETSSRIDTGIARLLNQGWRFYRG